MSHLTLIMLVALPLLQLVYASNSCVASYVSRYDKRAAYGSVVDRADQAPDASKAPGSLPKRADGSFVASGSYSNPCTGCLGGDYLMVGSHLSTLRSFCVFSCSSKVP